MMVTADHYFKERYAVLTEKMRDLSSMIGYAPISSDYNRLEIQLYAYAQQKWTVVGYLGRVLLVSIPDWSRRCTKDAGLTNRGLIIVD